MQDHTPFSILFISTLQKILATDSCFTIEQNSVIEQTLQWFEKGIDFADALHLASSLHAEKFVSFDKKLIKKATGLNIKLALLEA